MTTYKITHDGRPLHGTIDLAGSKSISNRALIIRALCGDDFPLHRLASAKDTDTLQALLAQKDATVYDAGAAGTTYRFLTAYLAFQPGTQILTGTERMKQRPIGILVDALRQLGAQIDYVEKEGYPPLRIHAPKAAVATNQLSIAAGTSSQYITALLLLAPVMPQGLQLTLTGQIVSRPYIEMTLALMRYFGVEHSWEDQTITVKPQHYTGKPFTVEADWSAASYYYSMAALSGDVDLQLDGLFADSVQGDAVLTQMMTHLGVESTFNETGVRLRKSGQTLSPLFEWDFLTCPDLAQTLAVTCAGLGVHGLFTGLETLRIKETDRIAALQTELAKVQSWLSQLPARFSQRSEKLSALKGKQLLWMSPYSTPMKTTAWRWRLLLWPCRAPSA